MHSFYVFRYICLYNCGCFLYNQTNRNIYSFRKASIESLVPWLHSPWNNLVPTLPTEDISLLKSSKKASDSNWLGQFSTLHLLHSLNRNKNISSHKKKQGDWSLYYAESLKEQQQQQRMAIWEQTEVFFFLNLALCRIDFSIFNNG